MSVLPSWLQVHRGTAPLVLSIPHAGTELPSELDGRLVSTWRARKDTDWWVDRLYDFAVELGATVIGTALSRTAIDVNRMASGDPLYPGRVETALCPVTTFDGEPLYRDGQEPGRDEIAERRRRWHDPYHAALDDEVARLRAQHRIVVLYDCHSIRSKVPTLFEGRLPAFNIGTDGGRTCDPALSRRIGAICGRSGRSHVTDGRFRGGSIVRRLGNPHAGVHAVQMELACRGYLREPEGPVGEDDWPAAFDSAFATPMRETLRHVLAACLDFTDAGARHGHDGPA